MVYRAGPAGVGESGEDAAIKEQRSDTLELPLAVRRELDTQLPSSLSHY